MLSRWRGGDTARAWLSVCAMVWCGVQSERAWAKDFSATLRVGAGPSFFTGELGEYTQSGVGFSLGQEIRWRYIGFGIDLGLASYLTQPPSELPPFSRELTTYHVQLGPRLRFEVLEDVDVGFDVGYSRLGLAANSLVQVTGLDLGYHGAEGSVRLGYDWQILVFELEGSYQWIPGLPGDIIQTTVFVGFEGY